MEHNYPFTAIAGQEKMKLALMLNLINPALGGVLIRGEKGTAKSTAVRGLTDLMEQVEVVEGCAFHCRPDSGNLCAACRDKQGDFKTISYTRRVVELPVSSAEDRVVGSLNMEQAIKKGEKVFEPGLLAQANGNILYVDEINLLDDHIVDVLLDSDDFYGYHGGLVACVRANSGKKPMSVTGHTDNPDRPVTRDIDKEMARIVRSKILNPKWLAGLKRHGFKGAQEIAAAMDSFFGWDATAETAEDWMYQSMAETFLFNEETRKWMEEVNRWSVHSVSERLLEAHQRGMWDTDEETLHRLRGIYMQAEGTIEEVGK